MPLADVLKQFGTECRCAVTDAPHFHIGTHGVIVTIPEIEEAIAKLCGKEPDAPVQS